MRSSKHHPDPAFATTLAHGMAVLECFRVNSPLLSNKEIADLAGLSKATVSRLTYTLLTRGLLAYDAHLRRYHLGPTALSLGYPLLASLRIRQIARPLMKQLADKVGGSVSLGIRDRVNMVYIETSRGHDAIAFRPDIGATLPILKSAMGKAWLGRASEAECQRVLDELSISDPEQAKQFGGILTRARQDLERSGFCVSRGDWQQDVHAVAVPLRKEVDGEALVFNCGVLTSRLKGDTVEKKLGAHLLEMVRRVEAEVTL